jgi:cobyrinic acid a,c-diamide synthase
LNQAPTNQSPLPTPGIVVAALRGGSGKTIFSVGIIAALRSLGRSIAPFKKGPDYIDAGWLALSAGRPCYNLDTFLIDSDRIVQSFQEHSREADLAIEALDRIPDSAYKGALRALADFAVVRRF